VDHPSKAFYPSKQRGPTPEVGGLLRDQGSGFVGPKPLEH